MTTNIADLNSNVFLIHGHDVNNLATLELLVESMNLTPMVLSKIPNKGRTIIEKFEDVANECGYAIALMTPDDKQAADVNGEEKFRARQNLFLELGWFMAKRGRSKIILLHKGSVELPSDLLGVVYIPFEDSIIEVKDGIKSELNIK